MKLALDVEWVPGTRAAAFGELLADIAALESPTLLGLVPCIENAGWGAILSPDGKKLAIHHRTRSGELLPSPCAILSHKTFARELTEQAKPFIVRQ